MLEPAEVPHMPQDLLDEEKKLLLLQFQNFFNFSTERSSLLQMLIYNNKLMNQEEVADYREVQEEEESHTIERPNQKNEIVIIKKPSEHPLFPEADENNFGDDEA
jgi:hypothetical protein